MTIDRNRLHAMFDVLLTVFAVLVLPSVLLEAFGDQNDPLLGRRRRRPTKTAAVISEELDPEIGKLDEEGGRG